MEVLHRPDVFAVPYGPKMEDGETPEECAARELVEECGLTAASWRKLGEFWAAPDYSTEYVHAFEGTELTDVGIGEREEGDDLVTERLDDPIESGA